MCNSTALVFSQCFAIITTILLGIFPLHKETLYLLAVTPQFTIHEKVVPVGSSKGDPCMCHICPLTLEDQKPLWDSVGTPTMALFAYKAGLNTGSLNSMHTELLGGVRSLRVTLQEQRAAKCPS